MATAYSYLRPGGSPADRDRLAAPLARGLVLAGEATWRDHPGMMHGAWFSGERAARRVLDGGAFRRTIVIGAGLAGIAAARTLRAADVEVIVLEAGATVGGRVRSDTTLGRPALCAFATGEHAMAVEAMSEDELCALVDDTLAASVLLPTSLS